MPKRNRSDYESSRKRLKPTNNTSYQKLSPRTADVQPCLNNQAIYEIMKKIEDEIQNLQTKRDNMLSEMLPTSDGRDMKYEDFTPAHHTKTRLASLYDANIKIEEFEKREKCWEEERRLWLKKDDEQIKMIEKLKEQLKVAKEGGIKMPKVVPRGRRGGMRSGQVPATS